MFASDTKTKTFVSGRHPLSLVSRMAREAESRLDMSTTTTYYDESDRLEWVYKTAELCALADVVACASMRSEDLVLYRESFASYVVELGLRHPERKEG